MKTDNVIRTLYVTAIMMIITAFATLAVVSMVLEKVDPVVDHNQHVINSRR